MNELNKIDKRFHDYFPAVALLHVARKISRNGFSDDDMSILSIIPRKKCFRILSIHKTEQNASELVELLQKSALERLTASSALGT